MHECENWTICSKKSVVSEGACMLRGAVYLKGVRYKCSQFLWELWKSGLRESDRPCNFAALVAMDQVSPHAITVEVCGYREVCEAVAYLQRATDAKRRRQIAVSALASPKQGRADAARLRPMRKASHEPRTSSSILRIHAEREYSYQQGLWSRRSRMYAGK